MNYKSKIYIAGHYGLVGSAIWKNLQSKGYHNLIGPSHNELDLLDNIAVRDFFNQEQPEYVILAAAFVGGIMANNIYRADFIYKNLQIQQNVIGESFRHHIKKLLFLGSTCIYPREAPQPMKEDCLLTSVMEYTNEPYAIAKIAGLKMCESFNLQYGTNYIAVMPTNLYGPNDNFHLENSHVMPAIMRKIFLSHCLYQNDWISIRKDLHKRPVNNLNENSTQNDIMKILSHYGIYPDRVELWGTGKPTREFLWSEEMADACIYIMEHVNFDNISGTDRYSDFNYRNQHDINIRNCHINIGTGKEISINELANLIANTMHYNGIIIFDNSKPDGTMRKITDVTKLHNLGWHHQINVEEGIHKLFDWYLNSLE